MISLRLILPLVLITTSAADGQQRLPGPRSWSDKEWRIVGTIPANDTTLVFPYLLAARAQTLYVADGGDGSIKAFHVPSGSLRWKVGRKGSGPGEYRSPFDLQVDAKGRLWVYDPPNSRLTILDADGALMRTISVPLRMSKFVPRPEGGFWGLPLLLHPFVIEFDSAGQQVRELRVPDELRNRLPLEIESWLCQLPQSKVVMAAVQSDRFYFLDSAGTRVESFRGVVPQDLPKPVAVSLKGPGGKPDRGFRPDPKAKYTALSVTADSTRLILLYGEAAPFPRRTLDTYSLADGHYLGSYLLPSPVVAVRVVGHVLIGLSLDPAPTVSMWDW